MSRAVAASLCGLFAWADGAGMARAGDWNITPSLAVRETFTDNANLARDNGDRNSDLITEVVPALRVRGKGGRASLDLDFSHRQFFFKNTDQDKSTQNLAAVGRVEVWDRVAFIDGTASLSERVIDNRNATTDTAAGQVNNRTSVRTWELSPYLLHHFGSWVETETRVRYTDIGISSDAAADTQIRQGTFTAAGGRRFQRLQWSLAVDRTIEDRDDVRSTVKSFTVDNDYTFVWDRNVSLLGGVGYENIEDNTLTKRPKGVTWNAGLALNPSRRTSLRATYGRRFDDSNFAFDGTHDLSPRTRIRANYTDRLITSQRLIAQNLNFLGTDADGNLIDLRTGLPYTGSTDEFGLQTTTFRQKRFSAALTGTRKRNRFSLSGFWEERKTDETGRDDTVIGVAGNLSRRLSRRTRGAISVSYRNTQFEGNLDRTDHLYNVTANLNYEIFRKTDAVLSYSRTQRESDVDVNDLTENAVVLGLRREF